VGQNTCVDPVTSRLPVIAFAFLASTTAWTADTTEADLARLAERVGDRTLSIGRREEAARRLKIAYLNSLAHGKLASFNASADARDALARALEDGLLDPSADILARMGAFEHLGALKTHLNADDETRRRQALEIAYELRLYHGWEPAEAMLHALYADVRYHDRLRAASYLLSLIGSGHGSLDPRELLLDTDPEIRAMALRTLGNNRATGMTDSYIDALKDPEPSVRYAAADALRAAAADPQRLVPFLKDTSPLVRSSLLVAMFGTPRVPAEAVDLHADPDPSVRLQVAKLLRGRIAPGGIAALARLAADKDWQVRTAAIEALGDSGDQAAELPLLKALGDGSRDAVQALCRLWLGNPERKVVAAVGSRDATILAIRSALSNVDAHLRCDAAEALVKLDPEAAIVELPARIRESYDPEVQRKLMAALAKMPDERVADFLETLYRDDGELATVRVSAYQHLTYDQGRKISELPGVKEEALRLERAEHRRERLAGPRPLYPVLSFGISPRSGLAASGSEGDIQFAAPGEFELELADFQGIPHGGSFCTTIGVAYGPLQDDAGHDVGGAFRCDVGLGLGDAAEGTGLYTATGPSIIYLNLEGSERDMFGIGWFVRAGCSWSFAKRLNLGVHADLHGWLGGDGRAAQSAGSFSITTSVGWSL
jgi:HEAT repeat protein